MRQTFFGHVRLALLAGTLAVCFLLGCARVNTKVNYANSQKIRFGFTQAQVEAILGPGKELSTTDPLLIGALQRTLGLSQASSLRWVAWIRDSRGENPEYVIAGFTPGSEGVVRTLMTSLKDTPEPSEPSDPSRSPRVLPGTRFTSHRNVD